MREKRNVDRLIALIMAVIMLLSLVAYDNRFTTSAEIVVDKDTETISVEAIIVDAEADGDPDKMNNLSAIFAGDSITVQSEKYYLYDITDIQDLDPDELEAVINFDSIQQEVQIIAENEDDNTFVIALFEKNNVDTATKGDASDTEDSEDTEDTSDTEDSEDTEDTSDTEDTEDTEDTSDTEDTEDISDTEDSTEPEEETAKYNRVGTLTLYRDGNAPEFGEITVEGVGNTLIDETDYYLTTKDAVVRITVSVSDGDETEPIVSGMDRVVLIDENGNSLALELETDNTYTLTMDSVAAGEYTLYAYDKAGNEAIGKTIVIKNPTEIRRVSIEFCDKAETKAGLHYLLIPRDRIKTENNKEMATFTVSFTETKGKNVVSVKRTLYVLVDGEPIGTFEFNKNNEAEVQLPADYVSTKDGLTWLTMYIVDDLGQTTEPFNQEGHIVFMDLGDPVVTTGIHLTNAEVENEVYSETEYVNLNGLDKWAKEIAIELVAEGNGSFIKTVSYSIDGVEAGVLKEDEGITADQTRFVWDNKGNPLDLTKDVLKTDGKHTVTFTVTDYFGNKKKHDVVVYFDTTPPEISATSAAFDEADVKTIPTTTIDGKKYYCLTDEDASEIITVNATDVSSGVKQLTITVNDDEFIVENDNDIKHSFVYLLEEVTEPGYYDVSIKALDYAGNESEPLTFSFMINSAEIKTTLSAEVENDGGDIVDLGGKGAKSYTRWNGAKVTYTATGLGLSVQDIQNNSKGPSGITWNAPIIEDDENDPEIKTIIYTATLPDVEGIYDISFSVTKPGSTEVVADTMQIIYDKTAPDDFTYELDKTYGTVDAAPGTYFFKTTPKIHVNIKDNYSLERFVLSDDQDPGNSFTIVGSGSAIEAKANEGVAKAADIELSIVQDTPFQLFYEAEDKAGNTVKKPIEQGENISIVYDTVDPEITVSEVQKWNKEDVSLVVEASDKFYVARLVTEVTRNGEKVDDLSGDYAEFEVGKETTSTLTYKEEGVYKVTIKVYDAAGNESKTETREFVIDKTDPTVSATSAAFGGRSVEEIVTTETYNGKDYYCLTSEDAAETITVTASDGTEVYSSGIKQLTVTINGEVQEIAEGISTFTIPETESGYYDITVKAIDNAGNESRLLEFGFMINREEIKTRLSAEVKNTETKEQELLGESGSSSYTRFSGAVITYTATGLGLSAGDITNATDRSLGIIWKDPVITEDEENPDLKTITITGTLPDVEKIYDISFSVKKPGSQSGRVSDTIRIIYDKTIPFDFVLTVEKPYGTVEETPGIYYFNTPPTILVEIKDNYSIESFVLTDDQTPEHKWVVLDKENDDPIVKLSGNAEITDYEIVLTDAVKNELFQLSYEAGDIAGNYIAKEIQDRFVYDVEAPEITVHDIDYWNGANVSLTVDVKDEFYVSRLETEVTCNGEKLAGLSGDYADYATFAVKKETQNILDYTEEGVYSVSVTAYDAAGNPSETVTKTFVIDKTPPEVVWTGIPTDPNRTNQNVTAFFTVKDQYGIDPENTATGNQSKVKITRYFETFDGVKGSNTVTISEASAKQLSANSACGQINQKASSYYFEIEAIDNAGNSNGVIRTPRFYIDRTAPVFTITPVPSQTNDGYYNKTVSFNINVTEQYAYTHSVRIIDKNASVNGANCISPANSRFSGKTGTCNVSVNTAGAASGTFALTVIVTDIFGNQSQKDINFVIDKQKPVITLGSVSAVNRENVTVPVSISDDYRYGTYNIDVIRLDAAGRQVYHNASHRTGKWDGSSSVNFAETFSEEGDYTVTVTAIDKAGNKADTRTVSFRIDKNAPILSITGVSDAQASACTATMSIDESFDMGYNNSSQFTSADVVITRRTDSSPETTIANLTYSNFSAGNPHTATYSFIEDGIYTITFDATDATGNRAPTLTKTFKVDTTAPVLNVSVADRNAKTVESYEAIGSQANEDPNYVVMNVSVEELFYTTNKVTFTVMKDGVDVSNRYFGAYVSRGEVSAVSQIFEEDGVYTVRISAVDELGNAAEEYSIVFKVDNTPPTLEKTNVLNAFLAKADANGNILLNAEDFAAIADKGYGALWDVNDTSVFTVDVKMDGVAFIDFSDLSDGYHKLTITVTDEVGQQSVQEFEFIYDGTAPRIIITGIENGESTNEPFTLGISLEDPEDIITRIVINGKDVDPSLYQETNRYEYAVEEYGDYEIIVNATDIAGNVSSTYNSKTGEVFSFQLKEETNFMLWIILIGALVLVLGIVIILIAKSRKKR